MAKKHSVPLWLDFVEWIFMSKGFTWKSWRQLSEVD